MTIEFNVATKVLVEATEVGVSVVGGYCRSSAKADELNSSISRTSEETGEGDEREEEAGTLRTLSEGAMAASSGAENSSISEPLPAESTSNLDGQVRVL